MVNYLLGVDYESANVSEISSMIRPKKKEISLVGVNIFFFFLISFFDHHKNSKASCTLYPTVCNSENLPFSLIDMPGFDDTRGNEEGICISISPLFVFNQSIPPKISNILLISSYNDIFHDKGFIHLRYKNDSITLETI